MRPTMIDQQQQATLDRDGFVVVPLLTPAEVTALRDGFEALGSAPGDPHLACHSSFHSSDTDFKRRVDQQVRSVLLPHIEEVFDDQRALPSNYIVKWPSAMSGFGLHQDLSLVDERHHRSVELWVALDDTDEQNGQLWMVPGSHRWLPTNIRGINGFDFSFAEVTRRIIDRHAVPVPLRAGMAIVFNHATLHFSLPNRSDRPRRVAIADLIPSEAQHLHYFGDGTGGIDVYEIDDSFWTNNNPFTLWKPPPSAQRVGHMDNPNRSLGATDLDQLLDSGQAIESDQRPRGAPNAGKPWCHRCGSLDVDAAPPDRWTGNVTLLCENCRAAEITVAPTPDHVVGRAR